MIQDLKVLHRQAKTALQLLIKVYLQVVKKKKDVQVLDCDVFWTVLVSVSVSVSVSVACLCLCLSGVQPVSFTAALLAASEVLLGRGQHT